MTSLPPKAPEKYKDHPRFPDIVSAYNHCLMAERALQGVDKGVSDLGKKLIYIRILGYLIHHLPRVEGVLNLKQEIVSAHQVGGTALFDIGKWYLDHYIRAFRSNKGRMPTPSNHASRPSFDTLKGIIIDTLEEAPQNHTTAKRRALSRDEHRCVVTKKIDVASFEDIPELTQRVMSDPSLSTVSTQCAHIFSESTNSKIEPGSDKREYAATFWSMMERFGYESLRDELSGPKVHRLENVMTLSYELHTQFDRLRLWFVATDVTNTYKLEAANPVLLRTLPEYFTFTTRDQDNFPVPFPKYIGIHAACAKVAYLSGATGYIDEQDRDMSVSKTLAPDGASASLLEGAIFGLQARG